MPKSTTMSVADTTLFTSVFSANPSQDAAGGGSTAFAGSDPSAGYSHAVASPAGSSLGLSVELSVWLEAPVAGSSVNASTWADIATVAGAHALAGGVGGHSAHEAANVYGDGPGVAGGDVAGGGAGSAASGLAPPSCDEDETTLPPQAPRHRSAIAPELPLMLRW